LSIESMRRSKSIAGHEASAEVRARLRPYRWRQHVTKLRAMLGAPTKTGPPPAKPVAIDYATWARKHLHGDIEGG
jgi:hypothetical protein